VKRTDNLEELDVDVRIILKEILQKYDARLWIGCHMTQFSAACFCALANVKSFTKPDAVCSGNNASCFSSEVSRPDVVRDTDSSGGFVVVLSPFNPGQ
jgi:hypothetical protein